MFTMMLAAVLMISNFASAVPGESVIVHRPPTPEVFRGPRAPKEEIYKISILEDGALEVRALPRAEHRYGRLLWRRPDRSLPLRFAISNRAFEKVFVLEDSAYGIVREKSDMSGARQLVEIVPSLACMPATEKLGSTLMVTGSTLLGASNVLLLGPRVHFYYVTGAMFLVAAIAHSVRFVQKVQAFAPVRTETGLFNGKHGDPLLVQGETHDDFGRITDVRLYNPKGQTSVDLSAIRAAADCERQMLTQENRPTAGDAGDETAL